MNFQNVLEELDRLYEEEVKNISDEQDVPAGECDTPDDGQEESKETALTEAVGEDDEIEVIDDEEGPVDTEEAPAEVVDAPETDESAEEAQEEEAEVQLVLECTNCGSIVVKSEASVTVDEETNLANITEACQYCEEAVGYRVLGMVVPYESDMAEPVEDN